jgi:hypothetical protein
MSDLTRRVERLEAGRGPCPTCSPENLTPVIRWPGCPEPPPPTSPEVCPSCGRDLSAVFAAVRAIHYPEGR